MEQKETQKRINESWLEQVSSRTSPPSDYVFRCISELLDKDFKPIQRTFSSKGMTEPQAVLYLIRETDKLLFPSGDGFVYNIVYDNYKELAGTKAILEILRQFVNWKDTENRF
jgi:hypothetical protein